MAKYSFQMNCGTVALGWSCELKSKRGKKQKGEFTHGSNFNETTS